MHSLTAWLVSLPLEKRRKAVEALSPEDQIVLLYTWEAWARPTQLEPSGNWRTWLTKAGRGWGKTRTGAEWVIKRVKRGARRIHLVGSTVGDTRDVMVEGESGILACSPPDFRPSYEPSKRRLTWPALRDEGGSDLPQCVATTFSADEPNRLRGPQCDSAWADEVAAWQYDDAWDQLQFGLRLGNDPRCIATTTPRPTDLIRSIMSDPDTVVTEGSTYDNAANLADAFIDRMKRKYEGTRLGEQELHARMLDDAPGALWNRSDLDKHRLRLTRQEDGSSRIIVPPLHMIVVGVDPAVADPTKKKTDADREKLDETGIVTAGLGGPKGEHVYVLRDDSGHYSPLQWATKVVEVFDKTKANYVVAEANQGGALVEANLKTVRQSLPVVLVHASRGKYTRAEPVSGLYEQGRVHHVGMFAKLEDQMVTWEPAFSPKSPDRVDALVWAVTRLAVEHGVAPETKARAPHVLHHDSTSIYGD